MKQFFDEYGRVIIAAIATTIVIALLSPISATTSNSVNNFLDDFASMMSAGNNNSDVDDDPELNEPIVYRVLDAPSEPVAQGEEFVVRSEADMSKFDHVEVDGAVLSPIKYTATSGSTIVTFTESYTESLSVGEHVVRIVSIDGYAEARVTIKEAVALISFMVGTNECQAEEGMTYREWVNSEYNTIGVMIKQSKNSYLSYGVMGGPIPTEGNTSNLPNAFPAAMATGFKNDDSEYLLLNDEYNNIAVVCSVFDKLPNQMMNPQPESSGTRCTLPAHPDDVIGESTTVYGYHNMATVFYTFGQFRGNIIIHFMVD